MFEPNSRYASIPTQSFTQSDGRKVTYVRRRFLPQGQSLPLLREVVVENEERLDMLTAKTLGDPEQFWHIGDANNAMQPQALMTEPGRRLRVPLPQA